MHSDVVVIGAGVVGAACARALALAGRSVTVLEASAAAAGTSGQGEGNILVSDKEVGPELVLAQRSLVLWDRLEAELADELPDHIRADLPHTEYERKGGLVVATSEAGAGPLLRFATGQRAAGVDARAIDRSDALRLEPDLTPHVSRRSTTPRTPRCNP